MNAKKDKTEDKQDIKTCTFGACERPARLAVTTARPSLTNIWTRVWWDDRTAPATASRYCKEHGRELLLSLADTLADKDDQP